MFELNQLIESNPWLAILIAIAIGLFMSVCLIVFCPKYLNGYRNHIQEFEKYKSMRKRK